MYRIPKLHRFSLRHIKAKGGYAMLSGIVIGVLCIIIAVLTLVIINNPKYKNHIPQDEKIKGTLNTKQSISRTDPIVNDLGMPFSKLGYDWNIWDLQVFNGRIYIGHGNSRDNGPNPNAGPIPIIYYDTQLKRFITQFVTNEEQIDIFRVLNNKLYVPGIDPKDSWDYGDFYRMDDDQWVKVRNVPDGVHDFDMASLGDKLFIATGSSGYKPTVFVSENQGDSWKPITVQSGTPYLAKLSRTYSLINFKDKIYGFTLMYNMSNVGDYNRILVTDGVTTSTIRVTENTMFPGAKKEVMYRIMRPTIALDNMIYITGVFGLDYQWKPEGLYYAPAINQAKRVNLPEDGVFPMDILSRQGTVYVLSYKKVSQTLYTNIVYKTTNLKDWIEVFRFSNDTFARSFEEINGDFYFGMGCYADYIAKSTGKILKISKY